MNQSLSLLFFLSCLLCSALAKEVSVTVGSEVIVNLPLRYAGLTLDISELVHNPTNCPFTDPVLIRYSQNLAPLRIRIGGNQQDTLWYPTDGQDPPNPLPPGYLNVFNLTNWLNVCDLAKAANFTLLFGINGGRGPRPHVNGPWNSSQARSFIQYNNENCHVVDAYDLTNEPNFLKMHYGDDFIVSPQRLAKDTYTFQQLVQETAPQGTPAVAMSFGLEVPGWIEDFVIHWLEDFLKADPVFDIFSYHWYPLVSEEYNSTFPPSLDPFYAAPSKVLDPWVLEQIALADHSVRTKLEDNNKPTERWITETGSAVGSGQDGLSNAFADGFEYLDKLGHAASMGVTSLNRQTLCGYNYGIMYWNETTSSLLIRPSYYTTVLYGRLVGEEVYEATVGGQKRGKVRVYAFSGKSTSSTSTVLLFVNTHDSSTTIDVTLPGTAPTNRSDYILTSGDGSLSSYTMKLNGKLIVDDGTGVLPPLDPVVTTTDVTSVVVPEESYGFLVFE